MINDKNNFRYHCLHEADISIRQALNALTGLTVAFGYKLTIEEKVALDKLTEAHEALNKCIKIERMI